MAFLAYFNAMRPFDSYLHQAEETTVNALLEQARLSQFDAQQANTRARRWVSHIRTTPPPAIEGLLQDMGLSSPAGLALMGLAEALLRIPDHATVNALIEDKLGASLGAHGMEARRLISRIAELGLGISHKLLSGDNLFDNFMKRASLPFMRLALRRIVRRMGHNFIVGENVAEAFDTAEDWRKRGHLMHFDMLGEGARTMQDADRYYALYQQLIDALKEKTGADIYHNPGVSIKLSALHPRFEELQKQRVMEDLLPRVRDLCVRAAAANIVLCIDAEEADRFELTLDIIEALALDPALKEWTGLGFALQAYQTRARAAVDWFVDLAKRRGNKLTLRLVKGAYWDTEIKRAQERGLDAYPVFTRKASTDCSYIAIAKQMLAHRNFIYPQFASHNALTQATITQLAEPDGSYEIQRLQGMGSVLFDAIKRDYPNLRTRIYAPVGVYEDLLTYLVRRLLENGANSNFVHQLANPLVPIDALLKQPVDKIMAAPSIAHQNVPLPAAMFTDRKNSRGWELAERGVQEQIQQALDTCHPERSGATGDTQSKDLTASWPREVPRDARDDKCLGEVFSAAAQSHWPTTPLATRVAALRKAADLMESDWLNLTALIVDEGKRTVNDALSEIREAVDFCRYYAREAEKLQAGETLPGPAGENNTLHYHPRGTFVCISPWNFPLAIFVGQVAAALVVGNTVIAKPAEQTPRLGAYAVALLHKAGVPHDALHVVQGDGGVGAALVAHPKTAGVAFTGSIAAAKSIQRALAAKDGAIVPLIAETGGINCMIVDSSALLEQVTDDVLTSGFRSAGQRCSALRVIFVQEDIADKLQTMLVGAMQELRVGDPRELHTDIGPVIDNEAATALQAHIDNNNVIAQTFTRGGPCIIPPTLVRLNSLAELPEEVFGPIVHIIRYNEGAIDDVIQHINATGYGLTFGLHTRIMSRAQRVAAAIRAGNVYVNRSMIGAVVGVQPFGGEGLSGTGPKAGGPNYLRRFCTEQTVTINTTASGGNVALLTGVSDDV